MQNPPLPAVDYSCAFPVLFIQRNQKEEFKSKRSGKSYSVGKGLRYRALTITAFLTMQYVGVSFSPKLKRVQRRRRQKQRQPCFLLEKR
jgi:hypothetical protein